MPISQSGTAYDNAASVQRALTVADGRHSPRRHRADEQDHQRTAARAPPIDRHLRLSPLVTSYARRCSGFPNLFFSFESGAWKLLLLLSSGCSPGTELNRPGAVPTYRRSRQAPAHCVRCVRPRLGSPRSARERNKPPIGRRGTRRVGARAREGAMAMPWHPGLARTRKPARQAPSGAVRDWSVSLERARSRGASAARMAVGAGEDSSAPFARRRGGGGALRQGDRVQLFGRISPKF